MTIRDRKVQVFWRWFRWCKPMWHYWEGACAEVLDWSFVWGPLELRVWRKGARP